MRPSRSYQATTLHDVALNAGVSLITASRALSNPGLVSEKTIARVQQAVIETGYIPNLVAGGLKSKRSLLISCLVPSISVAQFLPTVQTLTETLSSSGYQVILGQTGYSVENEEALLNTMMSRRPDGIVFTGLVRSEKVREQIKRAGIPVVETWDLSDHPLDMLVGFSHVKVGRAVGEFFLDKGWTRIGVASGNDHRALLRQDGFLAVMDRDLPTVMTNAPSRMESGRYALSELLLKDPGLNAIYCSSDQMAQGVMAEAQSRGLRIPEDIAICGFGNADFAALLHPSLTTVNVDGAEIGRRAAQLIILSCRGGTITESVIDVGFQIIERQSTATR